jgi:hypothetical protein
MAGLNDDYAEGSDKIRRQPVPVQSILSTSNQAALQRARRPSDGQALYAAPA